MADWLLIGAVLTCLLRLDVASAASERLSTRVCESETLACNTIGTLPRLNPRTFALTSSDIGDYDVFGNGDTTTLDPLTINANDLSVEMPDMEINGLVALVQMKSNPMAWVSTIMFYACLGIFMCFACCFTGWCICCFRYCCCTWCKCGSKGCWYKCCYGGGCGQRHPTESKLCKNCGCLCCKLGVRPRKNAAPGDPLEYPKHARVLTAVYMLLFIVSLTVFLCKTHFDGSQGFTTAMANLVNIPTPLAAMIRSTGYPIGNLLQTINGNVLNAFIYDLNATIQDAADLPVLTSNMVCVADKLGVVDEVYVIKSFVNNTKVAVAVVSDELDTLSASLFDSLNTAKGNIAAALNQSQAAVTWGNGHITSLNLILAKIYSTYSMFLTFAAYAQRGDVGIAALLSNISTSSNFPTTSELNAQLTVNSGGTLLQLHDSLSSMSDSDAATLYDELYTSASNFQSKYLPPTANFSQVAANARAFNQQIDLLRTTSFANNGHPLVGFADYLTDSNHGLFKQYDDVVAAITSDPDGSFAERIQWAAGNLSAALAIDVQPVVDSILRVGDAVGSVPKFSILINVIDTITSIFEVQPCIDGILNLITQVNQTLVRVPESIDSALSVVRNITEVQQDVMAQAADFKRVIGELSNQTESAINITEITQLVLNLKNQVTSAADAFNLTMVVEQSNAMTTAVNILNTTAFAVQVLDADSAVASARLQDNDVDSLVTLGEYQDRVISALASLESPLATFSSGVSCFSPSTTDCKAGGDGACGSSYCLLGNAVVGALMSDMAPLTSSAVAFPLPADPTAAISAVDYDTFNDNAQLGLNGTASASQQLDAVSTAIDSAADGIDGIDVSSFSDQISAVNDTLNSVDFSSFDEAVDGLVSVADEVNAQRDFIDEVINSTKIVNDFLSSPNRLHRHLSAISTASLTAVRSANGGALDGIPAMVDAIIDAYDAAISDVLPAVTPWLDFNFSARQFALDNDVPRLLRLVYSSASLQHGSLYYLWNAVKDSNVSALDSIRDMIKVRDASEASHDVLRDANGDSYSDDAYCLTDACIKTFVTEMNTKPLNSQFGGILPVPLSREAALSLPLVLPALAGIFALISLLICISPCRVCKGKCCSWCSSCCASMTVCCSFCCMLPAFLLVGALLFPLVLAFGDVCRSMDNIGAQYAASLSDPGYDFTFNSSLVSIATTVQVPDAFRCLVVPGYATSPLQDSLQQAGTSLNASIQEQVQTIIDDTLLPMTLQPQEPLLQVLRTLAANTGNQAYAFLNDIGQDTVSCGNLNAIYGAFKTSFCCDFMNALYWSISGWYLITWSLCACGFPAGMLAHKRFPHRLWGPLFANQGRVAPAPQPDWQEAPLMTSQEAEPDVATTPDDIDYDAMMRDPTFLAMEPQEREARTNQLRADLAARHRRAQAEHREQANFVDPAVASKSNNYRLSTPVQAVDGGAAGHSEGQQLAIDADGPYSGGGGSPRGSPAGSPIGSPSTAEKQGLLTVAPGQGWDSAA